MTQDPQELSWLAGVFEAGGTLTILKRRTLKYAEVRIEGDPTVVHRIADLAGSGSVTERTERLRWTSAGAATREFLFAIQPYIHGPRQKKITEILSETAREEVSE